MATNELLDTQFTGAVMHYGNSYMYSTDASLSLSLSTISDTHLASIALLRADNNGSGAADNTIDGDLLGCIYVYGYANSGYSNAALISFSQDGASSGNYVPGRIRLYTGTATASPAVAVDIRADKSVALTGALSVAGTATLNGNTVLGNAATDKITCTGRLILRQIANTTSKPGSLGEVVYCTGDSKAYVCTTASESAATWAALN